MRIILSVLALLAGASVLVPTARATAQGTVAIRSVSLVDGRGGPPLEGVTVVVRGDRIVAVGPDSEVSPPPEAVVLDAAGKWLMPGIIDVHNHNTSKIELAEGLALGVTSAFVIAQVDTFISLQPWSAQSDSPSPRLFVAPVGFSGSFPNPFLQWPRIQRPTTPEEARLAATAMLNGGAAHLKIWQDDGSFWVGPQKSVPVLSREQLRAILDTAHERGARVYAHAMRSEDATLLLEMGIDGFMHSVGDTIVSDTFAGSAARRGVGTAVTLAGFLNLIYPSLFAKRILADSRLLRPLSPAAASSLRRSAQDTLVTDTIFAFAREHFDGYRRAFAQNAQILLSRGSPIAVGSDARIGVGTHVEMELMEEGGLSAIQVITAATLGGARLLGIADDVGTIESGKRADLVLLRSNPLLDVRNARDIEWVMKAGRLWDQRP